MILTIIPIDKTVIIDGMALSEADMSGCGIPSNIHALQFNGSSGELEYTDGTVNSHFATLPAWAELCVKEHDTAMEMLRNPPEPTAEDKAASARQLRDHLLSECDWWVLTDRTATQGQLDYRQSLRDITQQAGFPNDVVWPVKP